MKSEHVVFGTGAVGRAVMQELLERGERVRMVNRSGRTAEIPDGVEVAAADLFDAQQVRSAVKGAAVAYQCAAPGYTRWTHDFPRMQQAILLGLEGSDVKLVLAENMYAYGRADVPMTEDLPYRPVSRKGAVRAAMSAAAFAAHQDGRVRVTAARGSDYFGPWGLTTAMGERVFYPLLGGKAAQVTGRADLPHSLTYTGDFGRAMVVLGEADAADGHAWHVPNDRPRMTQGEFVRLAAGIIGVEPRMAGMGKMMMRLGGLFVPEAREMVEMMYEFKEPFLVDSSRFEHTFGMSATGMEESIRRTIRWYRDHPRGG